MDREDLINSGLYKTSKKYNSYTIIEELFLSLLIIKEEKKPLKSGLIFLIKELKDMTGYGYRDLKDFVNIMVHFSFIENSEINDNVNIIDNIEEIIYLIDNNIDVNQLSRNKKIKKLELNILNNL